jgi:hypothetical protein
VSVKWEWEKLHGIPTLTVSLKNLQWVLSCHDGESFPEEKKNLTEAIALVEKALAGVKGKTT